MQEDDKVFLSRVFTVPKTERGRDYGRRFILNLKVSLFHTYQDLDRTALFCPFEIRYFLYEDINLKYFSID